MKSKRLQVKVVKLCIYFGTDYLAQLLLHMVLQTMVMLMRWTVITARFIIFYYFIRLIIE